MVSYIKRARVCVREVRTPNRTPQPIGSSEAATWSFSATGLWPIRSARGFVAFLTITWGLGILISAPCTAERRLLASDMICLSCLMTN